MNYQQIEREHEVVLEPDRPATASVVWLHGLGADGHDFVPVVPELRLPESLAIRFVFPHAPNRAVTINNGFVMPAWYDILGLSSDLARAPEDALGIRHSEVRVREYLSAQVQAGVPANKIVLAGFSQGGAIALQTGLRYPERLGGVLPLSTYLPLRDTIANEASAANRDVPILMCHGNQDSVVPLQLGRLSCQALQALGYAVAWREYPMPHAVCADEIRDISQWLQHLLA